MRRRTIFLIGSGALVLVMLVAVARGALVPPPLPPLAYVGSDKCQACHAVEFAGWKETLHSKMIQAVKVDPAAIIGDFVTPSEIRTFTKDEVAYTIGSQWKQRYMTDNYFVLHAEWIVQTKEWAPYKARPWEGCLGCHTTGFDPVTKKFAEKNIGCEACHGPGSQHVVTGNPALIVKTDDPQVCGQCHVEGTDPTGAFDFPIGFVPAGPKTIAETFTFKPGLWADGTSDDNHQQYFDWMRSKHTFTTCVSCHPPHEPGFGRQLRKPVLDLCGECHTATGIGVRPIIAGTTVYHPQIEALKGVGGLGVAAKPSLHYKFKVTCADCHMPRTAENALPGDITSHLFKVVMPGKAELGQPNSCTTCHVDMSAAMQKIIDTRQAEIKAALEALKARLDKIRAAHPKWDVWAPIKTDEQKAYELAYTNYTFAVNDGSYGIHNYPYIKALIKVANKSLDAGKPVTLP